MHKMLYTGHVRAQLPSSLHSVSLSGTMFLAVELSESKNTSGFLPLVVPRGIGLTPTFKVDDPTVAPLKSENAVGCLVIKVPFLTKSLTFHF